MGPKFGSVVFTTADFGELLSQKLSLVSVPIVYLTATVSAVDDGLQRAPFIRLAMPQTVASLVRLVSEAQ
jgi:hypothetical protein